MLAYLLALIAGVAAPVQSCYNVRVQQILRSPYIAVAINFVVAVLVLIPAFLITGKGEPLPFADIAERPVWIWFGGVCGVVIVLLGVICVPVLGSALNIMLACTGQIFAGLLVDHFGLFGSLCIKLNATRTIGAALVIAGIIISSVEKKTANSGTSKGKKSKKALFVCFALINGVVAGIQVAINGSLAEATGSYTGATLISMSVGLISTLIVITVLALVGGRRLIYEEGRRPEKFSFKWLMTCGGILSVIIVGGNAASAPVLGTGVVTIMNQTGMIASGLVLDATGFLGLPKKPVTAYKVTGMLLIIAGTALISLL